MIITEPSTKKFHCFMFLSTHYIHSFSRMRALSTNNRKIENKNKNKSLSRIISTSEYRGRYKMRQEETNATASVNKTSKKFIGSVLSFYFGHYSSNKAANEKEDLI